MAAEDMCATNRPNVHEQHVLRQCVFVCAQSSGSSCGVHTWCWKRHTSHWENQDGACSLGGKAAACCRGEPLAVMTACIKSLSIQSERIAFGIECSVVSATHGQSVDPSRGSGHTGESKRGVRELWLHAVADGRLTPKKVHTSVKSLHVSASIHYPVHMAASCVALLVHLCVLSCMGSDSCSIVSDAVFCELLSRSRGIFETVR